MWEGNTERCALDLAEKGRSGEHIDKIIAKHGKERIKETDFKDIYGDGAVAHDRGVVDILCEYFKTGKEEKLKELKKNAENDRDFELKKENYDRQDKLAHALELVLAKYGSEYFFLGFDAQMSLTSEFDDYINGLDVVVEFEDENAKDGAEAEYIGIAVDACTALHKEGVIKKYQNNLRSLLDNHPGKELKYYRSPNTGQKVGRIDYVIPLIIGLDRDNVERLVDMIGSFEDMEEIIGSMKSKGQDPGAERMSNLARSEEEIKKHWCQVAFLEQIECQLRGYLEDLKGTNVKAQEKIQKVLEKIQKARNEKKHISGIYAQADRVHQNIMNVREDSVKGDRSKERVHSF